MARILCIDDDINILRVMQRILEGAGHQVRGVPSGRECLSALREEPADLVITDLLMPEMDGFEVLKTIRGFDKSLPIIAMSGGGRLMDIDNLLLAAQFQGACRILNKPFTMEELLRLVEAALQP